MRFSVYVSAFFNFFRNGKFKKSKLCQEHSRILIVRVEKEWKQEYTTYKLTNNTRRIQGERNGWKRERTGTN